jgi:hypothetical protein
VRVYLRNKNPNDYYYASAYIESIPRNRFSVILVYEFSDEEGPKEVGFDSLLQRFPETQEYNDLIDLREQNQAEVVSLLKNRFLFIFDSKFDPKASPLGISPK